MSQKNKNKMRYIATNSLNTIENAKKEFVGKKFYSCIFELR